MCLRFVVNWLWCVMMLSLCVFVILRSVVGRMGWRVLSFLNVR